MPEYEFQKCVDHYNGDYRVRKVTCREHFLVMSFTQLTGRESLRDIEYCLSAFSGKLYHSGISNPVSRSTPADAHEKRDWRLYADFAQILIKQTRPLYIDDNDFDLPALSIAELYRERWKVELFFKWTKQHLHIKAFNGTSQNAVSCQILTGQQ